MPAQPDHSLVFKLIFIMSLYTSVLFHLVTMNVMKSVVLRN